MSPGPILREGCHTCFLWAEKVSYSIFFPITETLRRRTGSKPDLERISLFKGEKTKKSARSFHFPRPRTNNASSIGLNQWQVFTFGTDVTCYVSKFAFVEFYHRLKRNKEKIKIKRRRNRWVKLGKNRKCGVNLIRLERKCEWTLIRDERK